MHSDQAIPALLISPSEVPIDDLGMCRTDAAQMFDDMMNLRQTVLSGFDRRLPGALGVAAIAAALRSDGIGVDLIDCTVQRLGVTAVVHIVKARRPLFLGIGISSHLQTAAALDLVHTLREHGFSNHISVGGLVASISFQNLLGPSSGIDSVVIGEGEKSASELVRALLNGTDWRAIEGLAYRSGESVSLNPRVRHADFEGLPFPEQDMVELVSRTGTAIPTASLSSSRRCLAGCEACAAARPLRRRSPAKMFEELAGIATRFNVHKFEYLDEDFLAEEFTSQVQVQQFADLLIDSGLNIEFAIHSNAINIRRAEMAALKRAGLRRLSLRIESGSSQALKRRRAPATLEQIRKAIQICREVGVEIAPWMALFDKETSPKELRENLDFINQNRLHECRQPTYLLNRLEFFPVTDITATLQYKTYQEWLADNSRFAGSRISLVWERLRQATVRIHEQCEGLLPAIAARAWRHTRTSDGNGRATLQKLQKWRAHVGCLFVNLLEECLNVLEKSASTGAAFDDELAGSLRDVAYQFDLDWLGASFEEGTKQYRASLWTHNRKT
jgi:radical SAM superfamily enzyme YgiQ (UPF0313 family)